MTAYNNRTTWPFILSHKTAASVSKEDQNLKRPSWRLPSFNREQCQTGSKFVRKRDCSCLLQHVDVAYSKQSNENLSWLDEDLPRRDHMDGPSYAFMNELGNMSMFGRTAFPSILNFFLLKLSAVCIFWIVLIC
ncbi:hypothetical protein NC652_011985 [Populus alba x Populus x berolinensis]|nr:hypothetical protein NC652_011971 [Populus alba x Populus x berolinensis]KAJ6937517.1 hypothetical protein NC652_011985 [Populus alba x Populus x berolinensis]